MSRKIKL